MRVEDYIPARILELCSKGGISRYQLSLRTGISQSALSDIIKKKNIPTITTLEKICDAFGITIAQFFTDDDSIPNLSEEQTELLRSWKGLKLEEKRVIKTFLKALLLIGLFCGIGLACRHLQSKDRSSYAQIPSRESECYLCGAAENSPMPEYSQFHSIGLLYLGTLGVYDTGIGTYAAAENGISDSAGVQFGFWGFEDGDGYVNITSIPKQGIATVDISYGETADIDFDYLEGVLCQDCLAKIIFCCEEAGDSRCRNVFLIDFETLELYALPENLTAFVENDYFFHVYHFDGRDVVLIVDMAKK